MPVTQFEICADIQPDYARCIERLLRANLRCTARAHLTAGHIRNADTMAERFQLDECPGHCQLRIVRMREDRQYFELRWFTHRSSLGTALLKHDRSIADSEIQTSAAATGARAQRMRCDAIAITRLQVS